MNIKPSQKSFLTLESVAMTDIVMNLFIFFFISFSLLYTFKPYRESKIDVHLPGGDIRDISKKSQPLEVTVTEGGEIFIDNARYVPAALKKEFQSRLSQSNLSGIIVRADKKASVEILVKVLDAAQASGSPKLGVAIRGE